MAKAPVAPKAPVEDTTAELTEKLTAELTEKLTVELTEKLTVELTEKLTAELTEKLTSDTAEKAKALIAKKVPLLNPHERVVVKNAKGSTFTVNGAYFNANSHKVTIVEDA